MNIEFMGGPFDGEVRWFDHPPMPETTLEFYWGDSSSAHYRVDDNGKAWYMPPEGVTT